MANAEAWRQDAERELQTARDLRAIGQDWVSVYWHAGQAVEFMLKALRMKREGLTSWPPADKGAKWHRLTFLADRCSVRKTLEREVASGTVVGANWLTVRDWDHQLRYPGSPITEREARDILLAVANPSDGIMQWLQGHYHSS